jgi:uncharacterized protein (TIGR01244 family)
MTEFRQVTPGFAVCAQLGPADFARAAAAGFATIVNNRPEGEDPGQPPDAQVRAAAGAAGLDYRALPFQGLPPPGIVAATATLLEEAKRPVLAYCRSGKRSIMAWAMAEALGGARRPDEIVALAAKAGYDLSGVRGTLDALAPKS